MASEADLLNEGRRAHRRGYGMRACPYLKSTYERATWQRGWLQRDAKMRGENSLHEVGPTGTPIIDGATNG